METLIKAAQFLLSLSIIVAIHEFGHFITARMFKTRVEKFYLFFDFLFPFPNLVNFALFKKKIGETEYGLGWFPLGGYVKIAGMIDESMDEEFLKSPPQPWEFRSKKAWQRLIIMLGGIIMNVLLAFFVNSMILYHWGSEFLPVENAKYGFAPDSTATKLGLMYGDKIVSYNGGQKFESTERVPANLILNKATSIEVERNGEKKTVAITPSFYREMMSETKKGNEFISPLFPAEVDSLVADQPFIKAGAKKGDVIVAIDSIPTPYFQDVRRVLQGDANKTVAITVKRNNDTTKLVLKVTEMGTVGFFPLPTKYLEFKTEKYDLLGAFPAGVERTWTSFVMYMKQMGLLFSPEIKGYKHIGSFITMTKAFSAKWDWYSLWALTAFLSIAIAFVNLLPIPGLDGGHAFFLVYEMITGKTLSDKFMERAQIVGMMIIFSLMFYALGNDILRNVLHINW